MKVAPGKVVEFRYALKDARGEVVERAGSKRPLRCLYGVTPLLRGLARAMEDLEPGSRRAVTLAPEDAYGPRDPAAEVVVGLQDLPADVPARPGERFVHRSRAGERTLLIAAVEGERVRLDANHPLAGRELLCELEIVSVRDETPEELRLRTVHVPARPFARNVAHGLFPFDLFDCRSMPEPLGPLIMELRPISLFPPHPWGQWLYAQVIERHCAGVPGDFAELGVGMGGMSIFLGHLARRLGRQVYSFDSFEGLPKPDPRKDNPGFQEGWYRARPEYGDLLANFRAAIARHGLSATIQPVAGFFDQTLPRLPAEARFSFVHIDGDLYGSVLAALENVYDRVPDGGVIVVDDFFHHAQGPLRALQDFLNARGEHPVLHVSFPYSVFFVKGSPSANMRFRSLDGNTYSFDWLRADSFFVRSVEKSVDRAEAAPRVQGHARALLDILRSDRYRSSDIYAYWRCLEDFWDRFAGQGASATRELEPRNEEDRF